MGVHIHNEPGVTKTSNSVYASEQSTNPKLTKVTLDGQMQPGDSGIIFYKTYEQCISGGYISYESFNSLPYTFNCPPNTFGAHIKVTAATNNTDCTIVYVSSATNSYGNTAYFESIVCNIEEPGDPPGDPPKDPPPPPLPPPLPPTPTIPGAPTFEVVNPSLPSGAINIPGSGSFDGSYVYEEPEREGPYIYTPPPLDIPDPIPSPPPPPQGPGLFDFSTIMQTIGTPDAPITTEVPVSASTPLTPEAPVIGEAPIIIENPKDKESPKTKSQPINIEQPGTIDNPSVNAPIGITPIIQPEAPIPVQPGVIDPAIMDPVLDRETPLQPQSPMQQD